MCFSLSHRVLTDTTTPSIYTLSLHDALPISFTRGPPHARTSLSLRTCSSPTGGFAPSLRTARRGGTSNRRSSPRSEEHTSELQSLRHLVCRLLLEKKNQCRLIVAELGEWPSV